MYLQYNKHKKLETSILLPWMRVQSSAIQLRKYFRSSFLNRVTVSNESWDPIPCFQTCIVQPFSISAISCVKVAHRGSFYKFIMQALRTYLIKDFERQDPSDQIRITARHLVLTEMRRLQFSNFE